MVIGMDVALVEHAEHDVDGDQRGQDQDRLVGQAVAELLRRSLEAGVQAPRHADLVGRLRGWPSPPRPASSPGATSKESVTEGNCPWWFTVSGAVVSTRCTTAESGTGRAV